MRNAGLALAAISAAFFISAIDTAQAQQRRTCTQHYQRCQEICSNPSRRCYSGECAGYRAECMKSGVWQSRNFRADNVIRR